MTMENDAIDEGSLYPTKARGIAITPEMTEAGAGLIRAYFYDVQADVTEPLRELAAEVFAEMIRHSVGDETK